tara:strand:- start:1769 stop:3385 length:1617 start_codon:yes stop_codon:yes gene_type:complete
MAQEVNVNINVKGATKGKKEVDELTQAVKKAKTEEKELKKEQDDLINSFGAFGVSIGGIKQNFKALATAGKLMFKSIRVGLISTGIGAFVVAVGSLVTYFNNSKDGAEKLEVALSKIGATFNVVIDRVAKFGGGIVKLFSGKGREGLQDMKESFQNIGEEIKNDIALTTELTKSAIALRDAEREINVETARRRAEVEQLKLIAEDQTKTTEERLVASEKAFAIENDLLEKRVANAEESVRIQKEEMALGDSKEADYDKLAELEIALFNIKQESFTKQIELNNKINSIRKEEETRIDQQRQKDEQQKVKDEEQRVAEIETLRQANLTAQELEIDQARNKYEKLLALANKYGQDTTKLTNQYNLQIEAINTKYQTESVNDEKLTQEAKEKIIQNGLSAITGLLGENSKASKGIAIAQAIRNTYQGVTNALANVPAPFNFIQAGATLLQGMSAVKQIMKTTDTTTSTGGGGGGGQSGGGNASVPQTNSAGLMSQVQNMIPTQLTEQFANGTSQEPIQAYVVENEISNAQALQEEVNLQTTL